MKGMKTAEGYDLARAMNAQVNRLERENSHPVVMSRPSVLGLDISNACNANCIFCLASGGRMSRKDENAFRSVDWLKNLDHLLPFIKQAVFSSYEAILNPQFTEFVEYLARFHTPFKLLTNAKALTPDLSEFMLAKGLDNLRVSFHGATKSVYESIMRGCDFDEVCRNLMAFKLLRQRAVRPVHFTMVFCAMRRNIEQLDKYVELAAGLGATEVAVNYLLVTQDDQDLIYESMFFYPELYEQMVAKAKAKADALGVLLTHQRSFSACSAMEPKKVCLNPWEGLLVNREGDIKICCGGVKTLGNIFENDFFSVWNSRYIQNIRRRVNSGNPPYECRNCKREREDPKDIHFHLRFLSKEGGAMERIEEVFAERPAESTISREDMFWFIENDRRKTEILEAGECLV